MNKYYNKSQHFGVEEILSCLLYDNLLPSSVHMVNMLICVLYIFLSD